MNSVQKEEAFLDMVENHKEILYKVTSAYTKNASDREDLIQEVIYNLWKSFESYDPSFKMSTWVYRITLNVSISYLRKVKRKEVHLPLAETLTYQQYENDENIILLQQAIRELPEIDKAIMLLLMDGYAHSEIAEITGISYSNVSTKIYRIKKILSKKLKIKK